jgi:hypothetical protein
MRGPVKFETLEVYEMMSIWTASGEVRSGGSKAARQLVAEAAVSRGRFFPTHSRKK